MTRWILAVVALAATGAAFKITSPGWLALALFVALICAIGAFLGFASARVDEVSQGQSSRELELLLTSRKGGGAAPPARPAPGVRPATPAAARVHRDTGGNESFLYASVAGAGAAHAHDDTPGDAGGGDSGGGDGGGGGGGSD